MNNNIQQEDLCDIFPNKICDNCGKCLENDGVDLRAIRIEDIARNIDENDLVEDELLEIEEYNDEDLDETEEGGIDSIVYAEEDYVDAWDHIEYLDDLQDILDDQDSIKKLTEEVYPGLIKMRRRE